MQRRVVKTLAEDVLRKHGFSLSYAYSGIEDTMLVTPTGAEILSVGLPREFDELLALMTGPRSN